MNTNNEQDLEAYCKALRNRASKMGSRSVFYKLPVTVHKMIKNGEKTGFCDFPEDSINTFKMEHTYMAHYMGSYDREAKVEDLLEDAKWFVMNFTVMGV